MTYEHTTEKSASDELAARVVARAKEIQAKSTKIARVEALLRDAEMIEDIYGNEIGPIVFAEDIRKALGGGE